ncbi:putative MAX gene-associated protein-like [Scophthalmus maximus]|uniref:Putative MAX gene-associated protein-like n=1 Tax=Scophthalmus maximus TaxID=52904 RepID=A0A2U9CH31_SCOMX|nr:putative MAX gene-associated protein-like [Scophthalmus maximus]
MACKKKKKGMVLHHPGAPTSAAAPATNHPPACSVFPYPGKTSEGGMERSTCVTDEEADMMGKANMYPSKETVGTSGLPTSSNPHPDNLPPESICRGIRVTLDNNSMWNEFFRCKTEMILTKQGSRMFPYCRFRISGLQPCRKYSLIMDVQPFDNSRYRWTGKSWQVAGKAECHVKSQPFIHPESPSMGQHWMKNPVSFYKLKLTNHISGQEGDTILQPMHRYLPRLHVVQTDRAAKDLKLSCPSVVTFTFPQTEFMAVTAYQNSRFAQLKVDYNPFAKGLKEDASSSRGLKMKLNSCKDKDGAMTTNEHHPVKKSLKSLLANHKPRSTKTVDSKPSASGHFPKKSATENDQSTVPGESLCNSHRTEQTNPNTTPSESNREDVPEKNCESIKTHSDTLSVKNREPVFTKRKTKADRHLLSLQTCKDDARRDYSEVNNVVTAPVVSQNSSVDSNQQPKPEAEMNVKQHKRPAPLPLPALALFLKQRLTKSKKTKSKPDSLPPAAPSEPLSGSQSSATTSTCQASDHASNATGPSKDLTEKTSNNQASGDTVLVIHSSGPVVETALQPSSPSCPNIVDASELTKVPKTDDYSVCESPGSVPDGTPVLPSSDQLFGTLGTFTSTFSSTLTTSSTSPVLSPPHDTVFSTLNSPQTPPLLPSHSPTMKSDSLLPDPECSYFGFEPLSPASSPEPLPPLPALLALELDSTTSEPTQKAVPPGELSQSVGSTAMVFKWHTVLPPPVSYIDTSFTVFQPTSQTLPLVSITSPLLPSPTEPQTDLASSFQENEQSLPFPVELSPLALHLPLSPTFSSLDGGGLSPTPSIADLVHFFSTDDDLGMGVEFTNSEAVAVTCPPLTIVEANVHEPSQQVEPSPAKKPSKSKKKPRRRKLANMDMDHKMDDSTYTSMQPNLEEVEEQLFISFTSKEALKLHTVDQPEDTVTHPQTTPEGHLLPSADTPEHEGVERISACEEILLRDLKLMKHKQVIHPVLQEVGLKMNLLDPTLVIDLQYLGVRLPIPPPGVRLEPVAQEPPPSQGVSAAFVSRTGKTTDVTQIKGWREKFTPSEDLSDSSSAKPEAGPSSDPPKKNLSAFCSDMLDEYLENEGKLIDERAASFSQPLVEPVVYELPARSTSYVRTLDSVLKKNTVGSPTTNLISGFIPPSKRPKPSLKETKTSRKTERKQKGPKKTKLGPEPAAAPVSTPEPSPAEPNPVPKPPADDLAPLESDSELGTGADQANETHQDGRHMMTRALLRQKDLEDGVVWEGRPRTSITKERAAIALTSLFTLMGFVSENPTAPIQLVRRRAPPCLNDFCRLGCVCSSLSHGSRTSHCGRPHCMLGCSCLKQKEADSVSQPAERVRILWKREGRDSDPDPTHIPDEASLLRSTVGALQDRRDGNSSCARVRGYRGKRRSHEPQDATQTVKPKKKRKKKKVKSVRLKEAKTRRPSPPADEAAEPVPSARPSSPPSESTPKPSKRLVIVAECKWASDADKNHVLRILCEAMALDKLYKPFWIRKYLISPVSSTMEESGGDRCIQYKVRITRPQVQREQPAAQPKLQRMEKPQEQKQEVMEEEPPEDWQAEVMEEEEDPPESWQQEVEGGDIQEEESPTPHQVDAGSERSEGKTKIKAEKKNKTVGMALPFLTGISPAGFLSARRKQPGGTDHLVQVNGKLYPLAKIQLGMMGALHPANRLAAYLTGRVGSNKKQLGSSSSCSHAAKPPQTQRSGPTPQTIVLAPPSNLPAAAPALLTALSLPTASTGLHPSVVTTDQSAAAVRAAEEHLGTRSQVVAVRVYPSPAAGGSQVQVAPAAPGSVVRLVSPRHSSTALPVLRMKVPRPPAPPPSSGQRMFLQPVRTASGVQYYRIPSGKLVQLLPISKLRAVNSTRPVFRVPASDPADLDVVCVDVEKELANKETQSTEVVDLAGSSSSDTENSSDFGDESFSEEEKVKGEEQTKSQRDLHSLMERKRRVKMLQLFKGLRREVGLREDKTPKIATLRKAVEVIQELRSTATVLKEKKRRLMKRRDHYLSTIAPPGETKQKHLSSNQREMGRQERLPAANQLPAPAGGGASDPGLPTGDATDDDIIIISSNLQQQIPQAPPTNALPTTTPVHTPVHTPVQQSQLALQVPPAESHNAPVVRDRPKTIPNILSRRKNPVPPSSLVLKTVAGESPSFRALVPADLLALVGAALPGQHVLTLSPLVPPGVSSVSLTNQQIHVTSMPCPPTDQAPPQTHPSAEFPCSSSPGPGMSAERGKEVRARGGGATQSLMSLLDEIVILNQQTTATPSLEIDHAVGGAEKRGHAHGRELGLDNTVTVETEEAGLQGQMEITQTDPQSGPANGNTKSGAPAPPPLLQMKVGGATVAEPASGDRVSAGDGGGREGGAVAWRPMPRLVPLGLRGNTPS